MEAKAAAERQMHEQRLQAERAKCVRSAAAAEASTAAVLEGSAGGLQQQPSPAGERFVYLHNAASAWSRVRQLLKQREAPDSISSRSSSGASTPRGLVAGRVLGCPPSIPGLAFTHEALLVLISELLLHKIDADAASDDRLLLSAAVAAAGTGTHSSAAASAAPSRVASRPTTAAAAAGSSSGGDALTVAATAAARGMLAAVPEDGSGVAATAAAELKGDSAAAVAAWWSMRLRKDLEGSVSEFFLTRFGGRLVAEAHCSALVQSLRQAAGRSKRAALFGRCLGLLEPAVPPAGVWVCACLGHP
jgi:hypothetical protein